jgi:hypothetical protein
VGDRKLRDVVDVELRAVMNGDAAENSGADQGRARQHRGDEENKVAPQATGSCSGTPYKAYAEHKPFLTINARPAMPFKETILSR